MLALPISALAPNQPTGYPIIRLDSCLIPDDNTRQGALMARFVILVNLTDQGIRDVKQSPQRAEAFKALAENFDVTIESVYYTVGEFDMVVIVEGEEQSVVASMLATNEFGNIRTQAMLAYSIDEMNAITAMLP